MATVGVKGLINLTLLIDYN